MKKILQIVACISISLSCHSMGIVSNFGINTEVDTRMSIGNYGDCFLKISNNEYAQYHFEPAEGKSKISIGRITSTHVRTFGGVYPDAVWNIQAISYGESSTILFKDCSNNCLIDLYESPNNPNKCRIVGINGRNIHLGSCCFSIYDVSLRERSFVGNENKLIFLDNSGTYIVSALQNPIDAVIDMYEKSKTFNFKGPVIKISAIYGNRLINNRPITSKDFLNEDSLIQSSSSQNSETKPTETFLLNCSSKTPVFIGNIFSPVTTLYPAMQQIEKITEVKLTSPPPSKKSVMKRIADMLGLGVIGDMLAIKDGKVYFADVTPAALRGEIPGMVWSLADTGLFYSYTYPLQNFIPMTDQGIQWSNYTKSCIHIDLLVRSGMLKEYVFDTSAEAVMNRKQIAAQPWDNI